MADILNEEDLLKIKESIDKAGESTIPFPIVKDGNVAVVGDANKTELNKHNFEIVFRIPDPKAEAGYTTVKTEYKDIYIKPRQAPTVQRLFTNVMPLVRKVKVDGTIEDYSQEELIEITNALNDGGVYDIMYELVATVIGVHPDLVDYMTPKSVFDAVLKIIQVFPDMVNAGEAFFAF